MNSYLLIAALVISMLPQLRADDPASALTTAETKPLVLPLVYRSPNQKVLLAIENEEEAQTAIAVMREFKLKFDRISFLDPKKAGYSEYHLIIAGSNCMNAYGNSPEPESFLPIERFVESGGHLVLFGTFNGVNTGHLKRFGINCSYFHSASFRDEPGRTEILVKGLESIVPADRKMLSTGNFWITTPHVVMMKRAASDSYNEQPNLATLAFKSGRVTYTQVQPVVAPSLWIITLVANWAAKGAPTVAEQLDQKVVLNERELAEQRKTPLPSADELQVATKAFHEKLRDDIETATTRQDKLRIGDKLLQLSQSEGLPAASYAALTLAQEYYKQAENPEKFFLTIHQMKTQFKGADLDRISVEAIQEFSKSIRDPVGSTGVAKVSLDLADELMENGNFEAATEVLAIAKESAQIARHKHYQSLVTAATRRVSTLAPEAERVRPFREALVMDPNQPEANSEVGKYECLALRHWEEGFQMLAKGSDEGLRQLAEAELKGTEDPSAQAALGDLWLTQAAKLPTGMRNATRLRAKSWFWRARSQLSGQQRIVVEKKASKIVAAKFELRISVKSSGEAQLIVSRDGLVWKQVSGSPPSGVQVNSQFWSMDFGNTLRNSGSTRFFPDDVSLETATLIKEKNQGKIDLPMVTPDELVIEIADQKEGEFVLKFGS